MKRASVRLHIYNNGDVSLRDGKDSIIIEHNIVPAMLRALEKVINGESTEEKIHHWPVVHTITRKEENITISEWVWDDSSQEEWSWWVDMSIADAKYVTKKVRNWYKNRI